MKKPVKAAALPAQSESKPSNRRRISSPPSVQTWILAKDSSSRQSSRWILHSMFADKEDDWPERLEVRSMVKVDRELIFL